MKITFNLRKLIDEGLLREKGPFTNFEIIRAAAAYAVKNNNIRNGDELYHCLFAEANVEISVALNEDVESFDDLFEEVSILYA